LKDSNWHLDHIFPIQAFLDYGITDVKIINRLDNLQPLSQQQNHEKKDRYNKIAFESWLSMTFREYLNREDLEAEAEYQKLYDTLGRFLRQKQAGFQDKFLDKEIFEMKERLKVLKIRLWMMNRKVAA
jgi:(p)ppGpp synthase/HD superfamily hydrolase